MRTSPNIIITGTPGVGKTTHCQQLAENSGLTHLDVNKVVKERNCEDGYDEDLKSVIVDEDKVGDTAEQRCIKAEDTKRKSASRRNRARPRSWRSDR